MQSIKISDLVKWYINYSCDTVCKEAGVGLVTAIEETDFSSSGDAGDKQGSWGNQFVFYSVYSPEFTNKENKIMIFERRNIEKIQLLSGSIDV
jgi:hypothetical protein